MKYVFAPVILALCLMVYSCAVSEPLDRSQVKTVHEESTCSMPMCESLGGHDAIALQVAFGD